jgi:hypothetical protein
MKKLSLKTRIQIWLSVYPPGYKRQFSDWVRQKWLYFLWYKPEFSFVRSKYDIFGRQYRNFGISFGWRPFRKKKP